MLNGLDLFSGIGGFTLALEPWVKPIAYCENNRFSQSVLLSRMADGELPVAPIWDDVSTLGKKHFDLPVDAISAGFPCQDISIAGARAGLAGKRSGLYWEVWRLVIELKPRWVFLENVSNILARGGAEVTASLAALGYDARWAIVPASAVGAIHQRKRWFLIAHCNSIRLEAERPEQQAERSERGSCGALDPTDTNSFGALRERTEAFCRLPSLSWSKNIRSVKDLLQRPDLPKPLICRNDDGFSDRVDRLKAVGNSICPQQGRLAISKLLGF